jgi:cytoskeletal protein CcmA (bactofilin family)
MFERLRCCVFVSTIAGLFAGSITARAFAAEFRAGESVVIKADETIADNLYVFGRHVTIDGTVEGDLTVFGEMITINGTVQGDITVAGRAVLLGAAMEDARVAGEVLKFGPKAKVDGDVLAAGMSLETEPGSVITGDAVFAGMQALLAGQLDQDLIAKLANARLAGKIGGQAELEVDGHPDARPQPNFGSPVPMASVPGGLTIADSAEVVGKLNYISPHEAKIDPAAKTGEVKHSVPEREEQPGAPAGPPPNPYVTAGLARLRHVAAVLIIGLAVALCLPRASTAWADNIRTRPGASLLGGVAGLVAFVGIFILAIFAIVLVASLAGVAQMSDLVAFSIVGGIVGYGALIVLMWLFFAFLAEALAGLAIGRFALSANSLPVRIVAMILGVIVVALILSIPYVGWILGLVVFLLGLGGFCLWLVGIGRQPEAALATVPATAAASRPGAIPAKPMMG